MELTASIRELHPKTVFRISRGHRSQVRNVFAQIRAGGIAGIGEASPIAFYGESADSVLAILQRAAPRLIGCELPRAADAASGIGAIARLWEELWPVLAPSRAAQCALDLALWDWLAQREKQTLCELVHGHPLRPIPTFVTLGLSTPEELANKLAPIRDWPLIKIKSDALADFAPIEFVRQHSSARLAVDANCAWTPADLPRLSGKLAEAGVLFIEQPLPPGAELPTGFSLPIFADESCVLLEDVEKMPGRFSGFNIKLVKCGGLTPALKMARLGRELGLKTMVGCMLESSLLISAGAVVAQTTDFADLDGSWLLADDPFHRVRIAKGILS